MANITEYTAVRDKLQPSETGVEATAAAARRTGEFIRQAGASTRQLGQETAQLGQETQQFGRETAQAGDQFGREIGSAIKVAGDTAVAYMDQKEISQGSTAASAYVLKKTQEWNTAVSGVKNKDGSWATPPIDPDDPTASQAFLAGVNNDLEDLTNSVHTERAHQHMQAITENIRNQFNRTVIADMSTAAGAKAHEHAITVATNYSNSAAQNPAGVEGYAKLAADSIGAAYDSHPSLKGAAGVKERTELIAKTTRRIYQDGAISAIQHSNDPEATADAWVKKYPDYINGAEALALAKTAKGQLRYNAMLDRADAAQKKEQQRQDFEQKSAKLISGLITSDGITRAAGPEDFKAAKDLINHPGATYGNAASLFKFMQGESQVKESNPEVKSGLQAKLRDGTLTPIDVIDAANSGGLSHQDAGIILGQRDQLEKAPITAPSFKAALSAAKSKMVVPTNYSDFEQEFTSQYLRLSPQDRANATSFDKPDSLINKIMNAHMPQDADKIQFKVLQSIGQGYTQDNLAVAQAPHIPDDMTADEAIKKYGPITVIYRGLITDLSKPIKKVK